MILTPHPERPGMWASAFVLSSALHVGVGAYLLDLIPFDAENVPIPMAFPEIAISNILLEQLELTALEPERETLQPVTPGSDGAQAEAETLQPVEPDSQDAAEAARLEPSEAEALKAAEAEALEAAEAERLEAAQAEPADAAEPETLEPSAPEETIQAVDAETPDTSAAVPAEPTQAARVTPVLPDTTTTLAGTAAPAQTAAPAPRVAAVAQPSTDVARVEPVAPGQSVQVAALAPRVEPLASVPQPSAPVDPTPTPTAQPAPAAPALSSEERIMLELITRIRTQLGNRCLVALPQNRGRGSDPIVTLVSDQDRSMSQFVTDVLSDPDLPVENQQILVDSRQCAALEFSRGRATYPTFRVRLGIRTPVVESGERLRGTIGNIGGRYTSLLIVDDNGVVQDLRRFTRFTAGSAEFDVPVTRDGDARDTSQLLVAITSNGAPITIRERAGRLAEDFFPALQAELGDAASISILPFFVK